MESDAPQPDSSGRLRLVDVWLGAGRGSLDLRGGVAGVLAASSERSRAARRIADTVMGRALLDRDDVRGHWEAVCARRRDDLAASRAARVGPRKAGEVAPAESPNGAPPASHSLQLRTRVHSLLRAIEPVPSLEALQLADAWDVHTELVHAQAAGLAVDIEAVEERVKRALVSFAMNSGGVADDASAEIEQRHREVVEAKAHLDEPRRKARPRAVARYEAAVAAEKDALGQAGFDSYASFRAVASGHEPADTDVRRIAQEEFAAASAALDAARNLAQGVPADDAFRARGIALRAHAERLLARVVVGGDPPAELRALRIDAPGRAERVRLLTDALESHGVAVNGDAVTTARTFLASDLFQPAMGSGEPAVRSGEPGVRPGAVDDLDTEIARLDEARDAAVADLAPDDLVLTMDSVLDAHRAADIQGRRLPLVFDGVFDGLATEARQAALCALARASDVQSIVVTDDVQVMKGVAQAGGAIVLWSEPTDPEPRDAERPAKKRSRA